MKMVSLVLKCSHKLPNVTYCSRALDLGSVLLSLVFKCVQHVSFVFADSQLLYFVSCSGSGLRPASPFVTCVRMLSHGL